MKCKIPEISWHNRDPVLSVDIQPRSMQNGGNTLYRLASGGTDAHVLIWHLGYDVVGVDISLDLAADLARHQRAVNAVKWSPNGELLASGDDESVVFIWKQKSEHEPINILDSTNDQDKEVWIVLKVLRGHMEDIYDLSWAPNSQFLVSGSVDNSAIIWDVQKGKSQALLTEHKSFVQGVAWDPRNQYIATLSSDRYLRIFDIQTKRVLHRVNKAILPVAEEHALHGRRLALFHDDTLQTFFRRLCFTPDGTLLLTPAGVAEDDTVDHSMHTTYAFSRYAFRQPAIVLPSPDQYTVAVRCCPLLFRLRPHNATTNPPVVPLPYRMIFAVATRSSVYFYDTQQRQPFAVISNIHYTRLTDVTWSSDGRIVVVSSTDGFCSLITFESGELGEEYEEAGAVLDAAWASETFTTTKKGRKQKENDVKSQKSSTEQTKDGKEGKEQDKEKTAGREPLQEKIDQQELLMAMEVDEPEELQETVNAEITQSSSKKSENVVTSQKSSTEQTKNGKEGKENTAGREPLQQKIDQQESLMAKKVDEPEELQETANAEIIDSSSKKPENVDEKVLAVSDVEVGAVLPKVVLPVTPTTRTTIVSLPATVILDKEILSSDERFESPEKKSRPVTPIMVRRTPRGTNSNATVATPTSTAVSSPIGSTVTALPTAMNGYKSPLASVQSSSKQAKRATPISVRRTPRVIIPMAPAVNVPTVGEEALDAWPLGEEPQKQTAEIATTIKTDNNDIKDTFECTEDIRLVYEDTVEDNSAAANEKQMETDEAPLTCTESTEIKRTEAEPTVCQLSKTPTQKQSTPNAKTPRRVQLKTISTPKSKKKLLD